ncbi:hypothetical protein, partial [Pseudomonas sp.]|uniref:hypothetical protein n=1 Tax=Pseudomonas sp. TaxID=306 RepID=UPI0028AE50E7
RDRRISPDSGSLFQTFPKPGGAILSADEIKTRTETYISLISKALSGSLHRDFPKARNLYSAMSKLYSSKEGNICELYFTTAIGGSVKREKMKRNSTDLRSETWHAGGRNAILSAPTPDTIDIYRLSVSWKLSYSLDEPVMSILGTYKSLSTGEVTHALISGCTEEPSFNHAITSLIRFS